MKFKELSIKLASWLDVFVFHIVFTFALKLFCLFFRMTEGSYIAIAIIRLNKATNMCDPQLKFIAT